MDVQFSKSFSVVMKIIMMIMSVMMLTIIFSIDRDQSGGIFSNGIVLMKMLVAITLSTTGFVLLLASVLSAKQGNATKEATYRLSAMLVLLLSVVILVLWYTYDYRYASESSTIRKYILVDTIDTTSIIDNKASVLLVNTYECYQFNLRVGTVFKFRADTTAKPLAISACAPIITK